MNHQIEKVDVSCKDELESDSEEGEGYSEYSESSGSANSKLKTYQQKKNQPNSNRIEYQIRLLNLVRKHPCLYDKNSSSFRDFALREEAYKTVGKAMGISKVSERKLKLVRQLDHLRRRVVNGPDWLNSGRSAPTEQSRKDWKRLAEAGSFFNGFRYRFQENRLSSLIRRNCQEANQDETQTSEEVTSANSPVLVTETNPSETKSANQLFLESVALRMDQLPTDKQMKLQVLISQALADVMKND